MQIKIRLRSFCFSGALFLLACDGRVSAQDAAPPTVAIVSPGNNDLVGGLIKVRVTATDNVGVTSVQFFKQGILVGTLTQPPYEQTLDFNPDPASAFYQIEVRAADAATNIGISSIMVRKPEANYRGPGATLTDNGAFFKVWAPHATNVALIGDFNGGSTNVHLFQSDAGWWFGFQPGAQREQKYEFWINGHVKRPDPYGRQMENSAGASILKSPTNFVWTDGAWVTPAFENMIIYELHAGTYVGKNDGQNYPGNFSNLLTKLDYIKSIGANMIELLPVQEVPGPDGNTPYLGYAPTGIFAVESSYGTKPGAAYDELKTLVNAAHGKGLGIIFDVVYNHFSDVTGRDNWYWDYDGDDEGGDGGIYFDNQNTQWGPAPDWGRAEVQRYIEDDCRYWIEEFHADGLRWDATSEIKDRPNGWDAMRNILWDIRTAHPGKILIAENLPYEKAVVETGNFHTGWYVDFHHKLKAAFQAEGNADLEQVKVGINGGDYSQVSKRVIYAMSHDECRNGSSYLVSDFGGRNSWDARAKARTMAAVLYLSPGIPMTFQGEEFAQDSWFNDDFDHAVDWRYETDTFGSQMKNLYRDASRLRWTIDALRFGSLDWTHEDANRVLAFRRDWGSQKVLIVLNFGATDWVNNHGYGVETGGQMGQWTQVLCSQDAAYGGWDGAGNAFYEPFTQSDGKVYLNVPKFSVVALRLK
jgi:1,4-alpha-glucan branching enzyme